MKKLVSSVRKWWFGTIVMTCQQCGRHPLTWRSGSAWTCPVGHRQAHA